MNSLRIHHPGIPYCDERQQESDRKESNDEVVSGEAAAGKTTSCPGEVANRDVHGTGGLRVQAWGPSDNVQSLHAAYAERGFGSIDRM
jgi:hypothetical protein